MVFVFNEQERAVKMKVVYDSFNQSDPSGSRAPRLDTVIREISWGKVEKRPRVCNGEGITKQRPNISTVARVSCSPTATARRATSSPKTSAEGSSPSTSDGASAGQDAPATLTVRAAYQLREYDLPAPEVVLSGRTRAELRKTLGLLCRGCSCVPKGIEPWDSSFVRGSGLQLLRVRRC